MSYIWHILTMISLYAMLALALNLIAGYTGLLSMCQGAMYGIGAYVATLLMMRGGWNFFLALAAAIAATGLLSLVVALPTLRLRGEYFVLGTLGFQMIIFAVLYNWVDLTGGPYGIAGIPAPTFLGVHFNSSFRYFLLTAVVTVLVAVVVYRLSQSAFGRVLRAVRDDEAAAESLGKNVAQFKIVAFMISAGLGAVPGALFAGYSRYIDPTSFALEESIFIISILVIGGSGSFWGPIAGAVFMVLFPEALRFLEMPATTAANIRQIVYGLLLILLMRFRPRGFFGEYGFDGPS